MGDRNDNKVALHGGEICSLDGVLKINFNFLLTNDAFEPPSDGLGTKNPGSGRIRVMVFRVPGGPGTRRI